MVNLSGTGEILQPLNFLKSDLKNVADYRKKRVDSINQIINMDWVTNKIIQKIFIQGRKMFLKKVKQVKN